MAMTRTQTVLLSAYLATMVVLVATLLVARRHVIATLDTPEGRRQWRAWREQTQKRQEGGAVVRRPVTADEPPALILLRDYFTAIVITTLAIGSFLFAFVAFAVRGAFGPRGSCT
jgi:hypothetical protein